MICGQMFYRRRSYVQRGIRKTCGKPECKSAAMSGENNPFWGKVHDEATRIKIRTGRRANPPKKKTGPPKGWRQSPEAREKMAAALRTRWAENRDAMIACLPRGLDHHFRKEPEQRRYRKNFTPLQRSEWTGTKCLWCPATESLTLDHIIPVFDGGENERTNAQTLCHPCNLWKLHYVDKPRYLAGLGSKGGQT
jgi:5-methylcytosine-specific restriction endonuclease McrA